MEFSDKVAAKVEAAIEKIDKRISKNNNNNGAVASVFNFIQKLHQKPVPVQIGVGSATGWYAYISSFTHFCHLNKHCSVL